MWENGATLIKKIKNPKKKQLIYTSFKTHESVSILMKAVLAVNNPEVFVTTTVNVYNRPSSLGQTEIHTNSSHLH
jgi:hypothetical protein